MTSEFGRTQQGDVVHRIVLQNGALTAAVLTWGAVLHSVRHAALPYDLTIGQGSLADYQGKMRHHGSIVAPVGNRISGAQAVIAGKTHRFDPNQDGRITLHSGAAGTQFKLWQIADTGPAHVTLALTLPNGEGGFPGTRPVTATYSLHDDATLRLDLMAKTDAPTLFNAVNHSYWNMDGSPQWTGHQLKVAAAHYLPVTADITPTGEIAPVMGTAYDFTAARVITPGTPAFDHNFCLTNRRGPLRDALWLTGRNGVTMTIATTEPGIQIYDGRSARLGHEPYEGLAIEPQFWPDAPHNPAFPSILMTPEAPYHQQTEWRFTTS
jgi:aldose 1-epimerase